MVGASEAGLAAVERLLLDPGHVFNYVTLLAPGGISVGGVACHYTAGIIARMGLVGRAAAGGLGGGGGGGGAPGSPGYLHRQPHL